MNILGRCIDYINEAIGIAPEIKTLSEVQQKKLPYFIDDSYSLYSFSLLSRNFCLMLPREDFGYTPTDISKHAELVRNQLSKEVILLTSELTSYNRKRLIGHKVPFIVPGKQMYLPDLLIDIREHCKTAKAKRKELLPPSSQIILLHCILRNEYSFSPNGLINLLPYSRMTLNRAFDELADLGLAEKAFSGRDKWLNFSLKRKELWEKALPYLRSPVNKRIFVSGNIPQNYRLVLSGLSALAECSMIAEDDIPVYAIGRNSFKTFLLENDIEAIPSIEGATAIIEIWKYPPEILSNKNIVDSLSLYLSLKDNPDERIQGELNHMMENKIW